MGGFYQSLRTADPDAPNPVRDSYATESAWAEMIGQPAPDEIEAPEPVYDATSDAHRERMLEVIETERELMDNVRNLTLKRLDMLRDTGEITPENETEKRREIIAELIRDESYKRSEIGNPLQVPAEMLAERIEQRLFGLGEIEDFLEKPKLSEIMINGLRSFITEEEGDFHTYPVPFHTVGDIENLVERLAVRAGESPPDRDNPMMDAKVKYTMRNGETVLLRVNVASTMVGSYQEPYVTIRKPVSTPFHKIETWVEYGSLTAGAATFLRACVRHRANVLVVGATGSGKTSLLRAAVDEVPENERVVVVEDVHEIAMRQPNVAFLETRKGVLRDGRRIGSVTISDLLENAMRMRPDRIIVGETRKPAEVLGLIEAMNTGHDGSVTTTHANSADDGLHRLLTLAAREGGNKTSQIQAAKMLSDTIDVIVFIAVDPVRKPDGNFGRARIVAEIALMQELMVSGSDGTMRFVLEYPFRRNSRQEPVEFDVGKLLRSTRFSDKMSGFGLELAELAQKIDPAGHSANRNQYETGDSYR